IPTHRQLQKTHHFPTRRSSDLKRLEDLDKKIDDAKENLKKLLVKYTPEKAEVKQANAQIAELEAQRARIKEEIEKKIDVEDKSRSEEHTSELQSPDHIVCGLLL